MGCGQSFSRSVGNELAVVGNWSGTSPLSLVSITTTGAVRITMEWSVDDLYSDSVTFDVLGSERLVIPGKAIKLSAKTHVTGATATVSWVVSPTLSYVPTTVQLHHELAAGVIDGASDARLQTPAHATTVRLDRQLTGTFTLELYDPTTTLVGEQDETTMPAAGTKTGRASRLKLTTSDNVRLTYDLSL